MKILLWVLGGVWFFSAVLFVLALAGASARRMSTTLQVTTPESNRKRFLRRAQAMRGKQEAEKQVGLADADRPFFAAVSER
jgi:hypothetical protein